MSSRQELIETTIAAFGCSKEQLSSFYKRVSGKTLKTSTKKKLSLLILMSEDYTKMFQQSPLFNQKGLKKKLPVAEEMPTLERMTAAVKTDETSRSSIKISDKKESKEPSKPSKYRLPSPTRPMLPKPLTLRTNSPEPGETIEISDDEQKEHKEEKREKPRNDHQPKLMPRSNGKCAAKVVTKGTRGKEFHQCGNVPTLTSIIPSLPRDSPNYALCSKAGHLKKWLAEDESLVLF
jgi:hypothetical protein